MTTSMVSPSIIWVTVARSPSGTADGMVSIPAGDDGVGIPVGRIVFVGWDKSVGPAVLDGRDVLVGSGISDDTSTVTAGLVDSAVTISSSTITDLPAAVFWAASVVGSVFAGVRKRMP
jgi:hypothetical protein